MKEFLLLIRENVDYGDLSVEDMQANIQEHIKWVETLVENGNFKDGNPLDSAGVTLKDGIATDGPYVETKECVSGYYFLLANSRRSKRTGKRLSRSETWSNPRNP